MEDEEVEEGEGDGDDHESDYEGATHDLSLVGWYTVVESENGEVGDSEDVVGVGRGVGEGVAAEGVVWIVALMMIGCLASS